MLLRTLNSYQQRQHKSRLLAKMAALTFCCLFSSSAVAQVFCQKVEPATVAVNTSAGIVIKPASGARLWVCPAGSAGTAPCAPLTSPLFAPSGAVVVNPMTADNNGNFGQVCVGTPGRYMIQVGGTGLTTNIVDGIIFPNDPTTPSFGSIKLTESTAPTCIAGFDFIWGDSTAHRVKECDNGGAAVQIVHAGVDINTSDQVTATHLPAPLPVNQGGTGVTASQGNGTKVQLSTGTATSNAVVKFDANGNTVNSSVTDNGSTVSSTEPISGTNTAAGNLAQKNVSSDHIVYLSPNGSDSNDGLSWGSAKLTPQAAFNLATTSGANTGGILVAPGSYSCPTTWYSGMTVMAMHPAYPANIPGSFSVTNGSLYSGVIFSCTSGSDHTIDTVNNLTLFGIFFDFNNSGGGLILKAVQASKFYSWGVNLAGNSTHPAIKMIPGASSPANNNAFNAFYDTKIGTPNVTNSSDCLKLIGTGTPNAGPAVTNNEFHGIVCTGRIQNGIDFELNTDTNKIWGFEANNTTAATGDVIVFNKDTTGSDQDADNELVTGVCFTGAFTNKISMGTTFGNVVEICSGGGEATINVLGGNPDRNNTVTTTGLFGVATTYATAKLRVQSGVTQGSGVKHQRFGASCTTAAAIGATCTTNYNWTAAFPDNNYTWGCQSGAVGGGVPVINSVIQQAAGAGVTIQVVAVTAVAASYNAVNCWAFHD